ncbi:SET domain-containing protein-lysine N-methyltransferase [Salmonella enterica subsp. enterica serovar Virchow]|nr:SET domain-containing protein-lysine N-methyltransferase [Salmonella enterica subsp. enterica serovar Virchow]ECD4427627.1 SET domain-containing protein-lysine N-methyltransferase [Salmonella enterica subsp. enterica serovar Virchow]
MHSTPQPVFSNPAVSPPVSSHPPLPAPPQPDGPEIIKTIKQERPDSPEFHHTLKRTLDDNGPILRNPANPSESVMVQAERPVNELRVTNWGDLHIDAATKRRLNEEIQQWLSDEGNYSARFAQMLHVMRPLDDGPERGDSVFAKTTLPPYTLLGPYAGILHDDTRMNSFSRERRAYGTSNIHRYAYGTGSSKRMVSAFVYGNILSLINTATLPGHSPIPGKQNNVTGIRVGKNITFYVTSTFVSEGEELFIDYGPEYECEPDAKRLKREAEEHRSRSPSPQPGCSYKS